LRRKEKRAYFFFQYVMEYLVQIGHNWINIMLTSTFFIIYLLLEYVCILSRHFCHDWVHLVRRPTLYLTLTRYMCPFLSKSVFVFLWGGIYSQASTWEDKISCCGLQFTISITTINYIHMSIWYIPMNWKSKTPQSVLHLLRIKIYYWYWTLTAK
jgi:hypothetical protein